MSIAASTKTRVGVVKFSNRGYLEFDFNDFYEKDALKNEINNIEYSMGNTNTSGGLYVLMHELFTPENGDRGNVADTTIVITGKNCGTLIITFFYRKVVYNLIVYSYRRSVHPWPTADHTIRQRGQEEGYPYDSGRYWRPGQHGWVRGHCFHTRWEVCLHVTLLPERYKHSTNIFITCRIY